MSNLSSTIKSMRLRTLPLSLAGVCLGILLAASDYKVSFWTAVLTMLTAVFLQILSNLSNELGDVLHGTDTDQRQGPAYGLNSGEMTIGQMKALIGGTIILCIISGLLMIKSSFGAVFCFDGICMMMLGAAAISGAMKYTLGRNPYGYRGLGDIFVFVFFGIVAVLGSYFVVSHTMPLLILLPASAIGCFSVGVLNVNNIRDMATDAANRRTVAIRLGARNARIYQTVLVVLGWVLMLAFCMMRFFDPWHYLFVLTLPLFLIHLRGVWKLEGKALDKMLPLLSLSTLALAILAGLGFTAFLIFQ